MGVELIGYSDTRRVKHFEVDGVSVSLYEKGNKAHCRSCLKTNRCRHTKMLKNYSRNDG